MFPAPTGPGLPASQPVLIPTFKASEDPEGVASHVPHMAHFYDNSLQTGLMRDLAIDLEVLGEHLVLLGNQVRTVPTRSGERPLTRRNAGLGGGEEQGH